MSQSEKDTLKNPEPLSQHSGTASEHDEKG